MNQPMSMKQAYPTISFNRLGPTAEVIDIGLQKKQQHPIKDITLVSAVTQPKVKHAIQYRYWGISIALHFLAIYLVAFAPEDSPTVLKVAEPLTVSLIAPPAPEPTLVPLVEAQPEVVKKATEVKPKVSAKKVVKVMPPVTQVETPTIEATTEPVMTEAPVETQNMQPVVKELVTEAQTAPPAKAAPPAEKIEPPKFGVAYLNNPAPDYPGMSRRIGEEGRVMLKVLVNAEGNAESVQLEQSSGSERLDQAAIKAVKRWRFVPAQLAGQALSAYVLVPIKFSLDS